jgi:DNA mismatch endonuclease, patch repair protein
MSKSGMSATARLENLRETYVISPATQRSMRGNTGVDTQPERILRHLLWNATYRGYRKNRRDLPGKPDIVFGKAKLCIFVHGCFWHSCPKCTRSLAPKTNAAFWQAKMARTRERDANNYVELSARGFSVLVIWECEIKSAPQGCLERIEAVLREKDRGKTLMNASRFEPG